MDPKSSIGRIVLLTCLATALGACAQFRPTPYQPAVAAGYGYQSQPLGDGRYAITVRGNPSTSAQQVLDQLLYRASVLTLAEGRTAFRIGPDAQHGRVSLRPAYFVPAGFGAITRDQLYARRLVFSVTPPIARPVTVPPSAEPSPQFVAEATIQTSSTVDEADIASFSAQAVERRLRDRIGAP